MPTSPATVAELMQGDWRLPSAFGSSIDAHGPSRFNALAAEIEMDPSAVSHSCRGCFDSGLASPTGRGPRQVFYDLHEEHVAR